MSLKKFSRFSSETPEIELPSRSDGLTDYFGERCCALIAITLATGLPKELVFQKASLVVSPSVWQRRGTSWPEIGRIIEKLGVKFLNRGASLTASWKTAEKGKGFKIRYRKRVYMTETQFKNSDNCDKNKTYIVCNHEHAWVIKNGVTLDPAWFVENKQNSRRRIEDVIEIC
ncbi:hypothetical protein EVB81_216 [Rhizobium phage RHph_I46]|uniref:Uncharacterized protein n=1 Tax=Rhizobium phage RHph_I1_9 TaxID=2509729 RepID=A0A7S5RDT8_9CAUD|nr:hypothetical protein PP936_gp214 [Rhizobium phage RHph_I1_9]QIG69785.1 hypothetical protein EVB81_216 [Rhizobium phage RHph_I46]QIG71066.1 hypothetical protein EVB92_216 [Rhizobium phage RHph_I9]QIG73651.1 hypothetical protein EVC04_214 [Rhizobium phage RHph_I1_9]QIG76405.1 hypothetical protein EVC25_216 [Rhizobium phage RHph_I34]